MMTIPNMLTIFRILLTPVFIVCLFYEHPQANLWALIIFIVASITDAYDGYYARKYDQVTPEGKFLDPLADKILVSSAFISFAWMGIVEYWMVALVIFRDLFVTGLRMAMERKGFTLITSIIAKSKTVAQLLIIIFILFFLGFKGLPYIWIKDALVFIKTNDLIYFLMLFVTLLTVVTGLTYIFDNRKLIRQMITR